MNSIESFNQMPKGARESEEGTRALNKILEVPKTKQEFQSALNEGNGLLIGQLLSQHGYSAAAGSQIAIVRGAGKGESAQPNAIHVDCTPRITGTWIDSNGIKHTLILCK